MKAWMIGGLAAAVALGWQLSKPQAPSTGTLTDKVAAVADGMNSILPKSADGGVVFQAARAEGDTLILEISGLPRWQPTFTDTEMAKVLSTMACRNPGFSDMVRAGATVRIDPTAPDGGDLPSLSINRCEAV